ncbi:hypothetical protein LEP1GSC043_0752 [Leptospira weilii str. Ecochallenge]|uniref:Uncharacterized protein n=1 Tax=Leptospira weilii str. Ecochallenge TaxID=1049986 RepID=N1UAV6_9LEPT|nr:hypothetical protein LEP1GSC043_0752 [Leptospira weilii str. Ecochallenge]
MGLISNFKVNFSPAVLLLFLLSFSLFSETKILPLEDLQKTDSNFREKTGTIKF